MDHVIDRGKYDDDDILTTSQCAKEASINRRTILAWIHRGQLRATRPVGERAHYRIRWVDFWEAMHQPPARRKKKGESSSDG